MKAKTTIRERKEIETEMKNPLTEGKVILVTGIETTVFRTEEYDVPVAFYKCSDTGDEFTTPEQSEAWTDNLYGQYRKRHGIPSPDEIRSIRESYGMTLRQITLLLGFGVNQYAQYEKGQVPSESNGKLLRLAMKKENLLTLLKSSENCFGKEEYRMLRKNISSKSFQIQGEC